MLPVANKEAVAKPQGKASAEKKAAKKKAVKKKAKRKAAKAKKIAKKRAHKSHAPDENSYQAPAIGTEDLPMPQKVEE